MAISLTNSAAKRVRSYIDKRKKCLGLRLGVKKTGCSGYAYVIDYADKINSDDIVFKNQGISIFINTGALKIIDGTEVDFIKQGMDEVFKFRNPNITGECGCGESFNI